MDGAATTILLCCLLQGITSEDWPVSIPQRVDGLAGSCVAIPCSFHVGSGWESYLDASCKAKWLRGRWRETVFDSDLPGTNANRNSLQGKLLGNLSSRNCTTIFSSLSSHHYDRYYFRLECGHSLKYTYSSASVTLSIQDSVSNPVITPSRVEVEEGTLVALNCSSLASCPVLPPTLTWLPDLGDAEEALDNMLMVSVLTFNASYLHNGQKITCSSLYGRQDGQSDISSEKSLTISVLYPPMNTSVNVASAPVLEGRAVTLTCSSSANPPASSFAWFRVDADKVTPEGSKKKLVLTASGFSKESQFYCEATNKYGTQNSTAVQIDVQYPPKYAAVSVAPSGPLVEGVSVTLSCSSDANPAATHYSWFRVRGDDNEPTGTGETFTINSTDPSHDGEYYCQAENMHGERRSASIQLDIHYPPKNTSVGVSPPGPVPDGSPVTLTCHSVAKPAAENVTWFGVDGGRREDVGSGREFTFNATKLSTEEFYCEAQNLYGAKESDLISINVTFPAEILPSSSCVRIFSQIRCSCESHGNPAPYLEWQLSGETVNQTADVSVREVSVENTGLTSFITLHPSDDDILVCLSANSVGSDSLAFNMSSSESQLGIHTTALLIGCVAGAVGVILLCALLQIIICRTKKCCQSNDREPVTTSEATAGVIAAETESVCVTTHMLEGDGGDEDLHDANVDCAERQAKPDGKSDNEQRNGLQDGQVRHDSPAPEK